MRVLDAPTWIKLGFSVALLAVASMALVPLMPSLGFATTTCSEDSDCNDDEYCSDWGVCEPANPFGGTSEPMTCEECAWSCAKWIANNPLLSIGCSLACIVFVC